MSIQCELCPKGCVIAPGQSGECRVRVNVDGRLTAVTYGHPCSAHVDPVEKKPMFHFLPGTRIFSLATVGCNLHCKNCQNWEISQACPEDTEAFDLPPKDIPRVASESQCRSVAYTYTEPLVYYEYTLDSSMHCRNAGVRNVIVSAAFINPDPMKKLCAYIDGATIDIKAMSDQFYRDVCEGALAPVLNACVVAKSKDVFVEISNLVIPTLNDTDADFQKLCRWLVSDMGPDTPLHFLRFFPRHRMAHLPPTPAVTLQRARDIARAEGVRYIYIGNLDLQDAQNTFCPGCKKLLIERRGYFIAQDRVSGGKCPDCGFQISGVWT